MARDEKVDVIGLSGLITPSLDEMVHLASEMEREGMDLPLLIGGATTSKVHTAVKIAPRYSGPAVYVLDASRAVGVVSNLLSPANKAGFVDGIRTEYAEVTARHERAEAAKRPSAAGQGPRQPAAAGLGQLPPYRAQIHRHTRDR